MLIKLLALVLPLGLDTFAVSAALGAARPPSRAHRVRVSMLFTAFEAAMPLVGLAIGAPLARAIGSAAEPLAAAVLIVFGLYTLRGDDDERVGRLADARGASALLLGLSISLDELAIGFTLGLLRLPAALVIALIALQAFVVTQLGLRLGSRLGETRREVAERLAGLVLAGLGVALLVS